MAQASPTLSVADLQKLLDQQQEKVEGLLRRRAQLQQTIEKLDDEIQNFLTNGGRGRRRQPRVKNETSLRAVVVGILGKHKKGLALADITEQVKASGYKSQSRNFKNVVYQCVYHTAEISLDEKSGLYRLKK